MSRIIVSDDVYRLIQRVANSEFSAPATPLDEERWVLPLASDVYDRVEAARLPGEPMDSCMLRLLSPHMCATL